MTDMLGKIEAVPGPGGQLIWKAKVKPPPHPFWVFCHTLYRWHVWILIMMIIVGTN